MKETAIKINSQETIPICSAAVKLGYTTEEQVHDVLREQQRRRSNGQADILIGALMKEMGFISNSQLRKVLKYGKQYRYPLYEDAIQLAVRIKASLGDDGRSLVLATIESGKTSINLSAQIAVSMALMNNGKVLLLDANLRSPSLHTITGVKQSPGFTDLLAGNATLQDAITSTRVNGLDVMSSGTVLVDYMSLLLSERCATILDQLSDIYRYVIINTAPLLNNSDAALLASRTDGAVIAVTAGGQSKSDVIEAKRILDGLLVNVLGSVLCHAAPTKNINTDKPGLTSKVIRMFKS